MANRRYDSSSRNARGASHVRREPAARSHDVRTARSSNSYARSSTRYSSRASRNASSASVQLTTESDLSSRRRKRGNQPNYIETMRHKNSKRRLGVGVVIGVVIVAIAIAAGFLAFRGSVGSQLSLRDSDASSALVAVRAEEPYYAVITAELGATAEPLQHEGPDVVLLAYVDRANKTISLVNIPAGLQVATETGTCRIADLAALGDAALISAISNYAKVDISHYVKVPDGGISGIVDTLGGIEVNIDQVIDDPHAGDVYLPAGTYTLTGAAALTYLRADNLRMGTADQLQNQVDFAALLLAKLFEEGGSFATRVESIAGCFQTDLSLGDIEALQGWLRDVPASAIGRTVLPGYLTEVTGVAETGDALYIGSADDMASIIATLESGSELDITSSSEIKPADPASFTVEVQNGTSIVGLAAETAASLADAGFNVVKIDNAEQPVYDETLVVYKGEEGPSRAKAVIGALGMGRAVSGEIYYSFDDDILVIVGSDYKPFV